MLALVKLELKKIFSKKDILIISFILILAPLLFGICMINHIAGINFSGQVSIDSYGIMIWSFLKYLFVLYLVPIYLLCCFVAKEIESRSVNIMLSNCERKKVFVAKMISYVMVITLFFVLFQISSILTYSFLIKNTSFASTMAESSVTEMIFLYIFQWLELIFVAGISYLLCCIIKGNAVLVLGIGVIILEKILVNFESIRRFLPYYISDYSYYSMIPKDMLIRQNIFSCLIYFILIAGCFFAALIIWNKKDF